MTHIARLGDICRIQSGGTPRRDATGLYGGDIPWVKIADMDAADGVVVSTEETLTDAGLAAIRDRVFPTGTLLLAMYGSVGKVATAGERLATNQAILGIEVTRTDLLLPDYLRWWLRSIQPRLAHDSRGVTQQNISATIVRNLQVPLRSLAEQRRIAAMLDKADAIRRKRRESIKLLDVFLRSAFLEMFGDPVRNEKGWPKGVIGDVATDTQYGTSAKANSEGVGLPVLRMGNITVDGAIDLSDMKWCEIAKPDLAAYTVRRGDLLFNRTNSPELVGKTAVWDRDDSCAFAGYLVRVRFDEARVLPEFVSAYLNSAQGKRMLFFKAKPSNNMSNISASEFRRLPIPLPPLAEQRRFVAVAAKAKRSIERGRSAETVAATLFDSLAQRAFAGER